METLVSGIDLWKFYFQIRARCALTSAFDKMLHAQKKLQAIAFFAGKHFFCSQTLFCRQTLFFAGKCFFLQATLFIEKKIANNENLSSYLSQGDGGLKKNNPYLTKLVRE
jgi:hypothetical protein